MQPLAVRRPVRALEVEASPVQVAPKNPVDTALEAGVQPVQVAPTNPPVKALEVANNGCGRTQSHTVIVIQQKETGFDPAESLLTRQQFIVQQLFLARAKKSAKRL